MSKSDKGSEFAPNRFKESAHFGQEIRTETAPSRNSHPTDKSMGVLGNAMRGGPTDVSHSLTGAGEVKTYNDDGRKKRR